jgi:hypothetical protein
LTQETFPLRLYVLLVTLFLLFCRIQLVEGWSPTAYDI